MTRTARPDDAAAWAVYLHPRHAGQPVDARDRCAQTLTVISSLIRIGDSLLDVGAGTGRLAQPLAHCVGHVTALDRTPALLEILRRQASTYRIESLTVLDADWETAELAAHEVVLAAGSLDRLSDLPGALTKLVAATQRTLVITVGDATDLPHRAAVRAIWGRDTEPGIPEYLYILGSLWQIGIRANQNVVQEDRHFCYVTPREAAEQLAPIGARTEEIQRFAREMTPPLEPRSDGWHYLHRFPVGVLMRRPGV